MRKDSVIAPILTNAKRFVPPRSAPVSLRNSIANTREQHCSAALANDHKGKICGKSRWIPTGRRRPYSVCVTHAQSSGSSSDLARFARASASLVGRVTAKTVRSEEHTSELQSRSDLVCRLLLEKKNKTY